jgi:hypothetical protein
MKKNNCIGKFFIYPALNKGCRNLFVAIFLCFLTAVLPYNKVTAQTKLTDAAAANISTVYDEIPVTVLIDAYGDITLNVIYTSDNLLYINVEELFKKLKINCKVSISGDSITGFTENENKPYLINYNFRQIMASSKMLNNQKGLIKEMGIVYMESSLFAEAFGLTITFNFRSLTCFLKSNFELPLLKELRLEKVHNSLSKIKGTIKADTILNRNYHLFKFGMADWAFTTTQQWGKNAMGRFNLGIGAELFFGQADISYNYNSQFKFDSRQLNYLWHWTDNDKKIIRQAQLGKISHNMISYINAPVIGAVIRNTPTSVRKASGYYTINETTEPNWMIELYINNELVDYTRADASGRYIFKVPIVYGYTTAKLKYYGSVGEERTEERTFNTAFTLMPSKEFEYGLSAGILQDSLNSHMGKAEFNYGVNRILTVGAGVEYLSSIPGAPTVPFTKITLQPFSKLVLNCEYAYGVKTRALINYYFQKNAFLQIDYSRFKQGQLATRFNALKEVKAKLFVPLKYKMVSGYASVDYSGFVYKDYNYKQASIIFSGYYKRFSVSSTTVLNRLPEKIFYKISAKSTTALSFRLKGGVNIRPSATYNLNEKSISMYGADIEKRIKKGLVSVSYQKDILYKNYTVGLGLKYDLRFMRTSLSSIINRHNITTSQNAQGSLAFGSGNKYVHASQLSSVNKGGISLYPFLDINQNGIFDKGEHMVKLTAVKIMSSNVIFNDKDSIIRIPGLYAFTRYNLQFNDRDLENISWRFKNHIYNVLIDPGQFKRIDVPVIAMGEVNGMVYMNASNLLKGIGRILIKIYEKNSITPVAETLSEPDGYIQYLGLKPGEYTASVDAAQLNKLGLSATPLQISFTIKTTEEGDIAGPVNFILKKEDVSEMPVREKTKQ